MERLADEIWIADGAPVPFLGLPFSTRMTVVRLSNGELWVHSPIKISESLKAQIDDLGCVRYLIAPNHLHHLFLSEWIAAYPEAQVFGTDGVIKKRNDIRFHASLNSDQDWGWNADIESEVFTGSPLMEEGVFYHPRSGTLIVTDLVENFSGHEFSYWQRWVAKAVGILAPNGKTPLDWRLSFAFGRKEARQHLDRMLSWQPDILVMSHGEIIKENAAQFLMKSFNWLL
ncbi:DUF4336 domain-containing protein [Marinobacterium litorale]|jgi:hypothetical protein|uniref:DUF4336 domain-containing protein n=1 Tax=Marinobacterium litorale TaxID=404770 RepID=UPI000482940F|nr:DUF4336 domain-containing protein [Marinobacterium litorale]